MRAKTEHVYGEDDRSEFLRSFLCGIPARERNVLRRSLWVNKYLRDLVLEVMASLSGSWKPKVRGHPEGSVSYGSTRDLSVNRNRERSDESTDSSTYI